MDLRRFRDATVLIFAAWAIYALFAAGHRYLAASFYGSPMTWGYALATAFIESLMSAMTTVLIFAIVRRFPLDAGNRAWRIAMHLPISILVALARMFLIVEMGDRISWLHPRTLNQQFQQANITFLSYWLILGVALAFDYYLRYRDREMAAERLQHGLTGARLQALKMQIHPHFLFNTLNAISALVPAEAQPARRMVARLGDLLRTSLEHEETQEVTLAEELKFLEPYLEIEEIRLGDRLSTSYEISPATVRARVPHLILQPLVENSIRHGIVTRAGSGSVTIRSAFDQGRDVLILEVEDDGVGLRPGYENGAVDGGRGLMNIRARLEQLYGPRQSLTVQNRDEGGVMVRIEIPFRTRSGTPGRPGGARG
jgi:two-component system, LytTR family, sensor kinase